MPDLLDHTTAHIIAKLMADLSLGTIRTSSGVAWSINIDTEADTPDEVITVYDTDGLKLGRDQNSGDTLSKTGIMVRIRGRDHRTAYERTKLIASKFDRDVLHKTVNMLLPTASYCVQSISRLGAIIYLGKESETSKRRIFTINALVTVKQLS